MADLGIPVKSKIVSLIESKLPVDGVVGGIDLSKYQGHRAHKIRIVREFDGSISINPANGYWIEQEIDIPPRQFISEPLLDPETSEPVLDDSGQPVMELKTAPIESVTVRTWKH
jgi:hypothetical protein